MQWQLALIYSCTTCQLNITAPHFVFRAFYPTAFPWKRDPEKANRVKPLFELMQSINFLLTR